MARLRPSSLLHRLILCIGLPAVFGLALWFSPADRVESEPVAAQRDVELFKAVVRQMENGQPYYEVFGSELRTRGYPARSVFNWRQPLVYRMLAFLPFNTSQFLLIALSLALFVEAVRTVKPNVVGVLMVGGLVLLMALDDIRYFTESWAGACIGLSVLAYARGRAVTGAVCGLLALFVRELAAPYCILATLLAVRDRRWPEVRVWAVGAALYGVYYALHSWQAFQHMQPGDFTHVNSWLYWGGLPFLLKTWQWNGLLALAPSWVLALAVVAMVVAWWAPQMPLHLQISVLVYSALFFAVGQPFNSYWGLLTAPIMALWLAYSPQGLRGLLANAGFDLVLGFHPRPDLARVGPADRPPNRQDGHRRLADGA